MILLATHIPCFYKVAVVDRLAETGLRLETVFLANDSSIRSRDFFRLPVRSTFFVLHSGNLEDASQVRSALKLLAHAWKRRPTHIVLSGWDRFEYWALNFLSPRSKKTLLLESSIFESRSSFFKDRLKRLFLSRIDSCVASGEAHAALLHRLRYKGRITISNGVGFLTFPDRPAKDRERQSLERLLYLGRLSPEKNVAALIDAVRACPGVRLTIAGDGPLRNDLKARARGESRIEFAGSVDRSALPHLFADADALILPSLAEPWGLVLDEAVHFSIPVMVSDRAGSCEYFTETNRYGIAFHPTVDGIVHAICHLQDQSKYRALVHNVASFDIEEKNMKYLDALVRAIRDD